MLKVDFCIRGGDEQIVVEYDLLHVCGVEGPHHVY